MEERIVELELRYTEQQALLQEISEVVWAQQRALDALKLELEALKQRIEASPTIGPADKPPHY
jgi:SlyX protein